MNGLFLTPTRMQLLRDVRDGFVVEYPTTAAYTTDTDSYLRVPNTPDRKVTARIAELERAGWVRLDMIWMHWRLTIEGRQVLEEGR